jgi:hypothetical protein
VHAGGVGGCKLSRMEPRLVLVAAVLFACSSSTTTDDGGTGEDASADGGVSFLMPSPVTQQTPSGSPLPLKYGLARSYDGSTLFGSTWPTTPSVGFVVILGSAPITCATDFGTSLPVTDSPAEFVFPFFVDASVGAEAQIIGLDSIGGDAGPSVGSSGQKAALDAWIKSASPSSVSGTINYNGWVGSFVVPVCP